MMWSQDERRTGESASSAGQAVLPLEDAVLALEDIAKSYGPTPALTRASIRLRAGRVHALLGENGAGKSTLVKILVGAAAPDRGEIRLHGTGVQFRSVRDGIAAGIVPIYQHLSLFPHLSVLENLSAFAFGTAKGLLSGPALVPRETARIWLGRVGLDLDLDTSLGRLSIGESQLLEIARGVGQDCKILVLDEPTAALTDAERDRLFAAMRELCASGTAILFISHKLDEVEEIADDLTVLRDGRSVIAGARRGEIAREELVQAMLGVSVSGAEHDLRPSGGVVLMARRLAIEPGAPLIDLDLRRGEILGIAGLVGSGALSLAEVLAGARPVTSGSLAVATSIYRPGDRARAASLGIGYIPADRSSEALFGVLPALENASASALSSFARGGFLRGRAERRVVLPWLERLGLSPFRPDLAASSFSGGNQQKLVVARNLALPNLTVLIALEPTRGVDVAARRTIHEALVEAASRGIAIVLASTDLDEVEALSHRILAVREGRVAAELDRGAGRPAILRALGGEIAGPA